MNKLELWEEYKNHAMVSASLIYKDLVPSEIALKLIHKHNKIQMDLHSSVCEWGFKQTLQNHIRNGLIAYSKTSCKYAEAYHSNQNTKLFLNKLNDIDNEMQNILS